MTIDDHKKFIQDAMNAAMNDPRFDSIFQRTIEKEFGRSYKEGSTFRESAKATEYVKKEKMHEKFRPFDEWTPPVEMEQIEIVCSNGQPIGLVKAPAGWDNYLTSGNFIGCRPIIKPGAKINTQAFETINFEIV